MIREQLCLESAQLPWSSLPSAADRRMGLPRRSHCTPIQPLHRRAPQPVAVLLARPGPEVVDEVEEVQQGVAAAGEPGLTGAAGVSRRAFDL